jgi:hypothetical protein
LEPTAPVAGPVFVTATSADALIELDDVELLFAALGSVTTDATVAVLEITVPFAVEPLTLTVSVMVAVAAFARVPNAQVIVVVPLHVPCDGVVETNVVAAGSVSDSETEVAGFGPLLVTVIV